MVIVSIIRVSGFKLGGKQAMDLVKSRPRELPEEVSTPLHKRTFTKNLSVSDHKENVNLPEIPGTSLSGTHTSIKGQRKIADKCPFTRNKEKKDAETADGSGDRGIRVTLTLSRHSESVGFFGDDTACEGVIVSNDGRYQERKRASSIASDLGRNSSEVL